MVLNVTSRFSSIFRRSFCSGWSPGGGRVAFGRQRIVACGLYHRDSLRFSAFILLSNIRERRCSCVRRSNEREASLSANVDQPQRRSERLQSAFPARAIHPVWACEHGRGSGCLSCQRSRLTPTSAWIVASSLINGPDGDTDDRNRCHLPRPRLSRRPLSARRPLGHSRAVHGDAKQLAACAAAALIRCLIVLDSDHGDPLAQGGGRGAAFTAAGPARWLVTGKMSEPAISTVIAAVL